MPSAWDFVTGLEAQSPSCGVASVVADIRSPWYCAEARPFCRRPKVPLKRLVTGSAPLANIEREAARLLAAR